MTEYVTTNLNAYIGSPLAWTDIIHDVIGVISGEWGIQGQTPIDRIADTGTLKFTLNNATGKYSPGHASAIAGWRKGTPLVFYMTYENQLFVKFYGQVEAIEIDSGVYGKRTVTVTAVDWLDHAAELPLDSLTLLQNKRADEAIAFIYAAAGRPPTGIELDTGATTFDFIFDTLDGKTKAYSELAKIANSEPGYIYIRRDKLTGETLVFENATRRNGLSPLSQIPFNAAESGIMLTEAGDFMITEAGDYMVLDGDMENAVFDNSMMNLGVTYGQDLINKMRVEVYPKRQDSSAQILFRLDHPMHLAPSGVAKTFEGNFNDPTGGDASVTGINMIAPVINTDYKMWTNSDGTGTDITASLIITAVYKADRVIYTVQNTNASSGYITLLQARGYGRYRYNPIQYVASDTASITAHGEYEKTLVQPYQIDLDQSIVAGNAFLDEYKDPRTVINTMTCNANRSGQLMESFLNLDVGSLIHVKETQTATDIWAWIQNISFELRVGGALYYTYGLKEHNSLLSGGLELVEVDQSVGGKAINYGNLPKVVNLNLRTYTGWIYYKSGNNRILAMPNSDFAGCVLMVAPYVDPACGIETYVRHTVGTLQRYQSSSAGQTFNKNAWAHFAVTIDNTQSPTVHGFYINGVAVAATMLDSTSNPATDETGGGAFLGSQKSATLDYFAPLNGSYKDLRMYNRILTAAEVLAMYNAGVGGGTTDGLVFQSPCILKSRRASYNNVIITAADKLIDNVSGAVGTPIADVKTVLLS